MEKVRSAGAIIYNKDNKGIKFLLLQYKGKYWEFARGHIEPGETKKQTAIREIKEETGLDNLKLIGNFLTHSAWKYEHNGMLIDKNVTLFLTESLTKEVKISHEHIGFAWLPANKALSRLTFINSKNAFKDALDYLKIKNKLNVKK